jgi:hypothetical protein
MNDEGVGSLHRVFRWSKTARAIVRANVQASGKELSALVTSLVEGNWVSKVGLLEVCASSGHSVEAVTVGMDGG